MQRGLREELKEKYPEAGKAGCVHLWETGQRVDHYPVRRGALLIGILTVTVQSLNTARQNPVASIKYA